MIGRFCQSGAGALGGFKPADADLLLAPAHRIGLAVDERFIEFAGTEAFDGKIKKLAYALKLT